MHKHFPSSTVATYMYVGMVMWEWCCVITATLCVCFVDQCHPTYFCFQHEIKHLQHSEMIRPNTGVNSDLM